MSTMWRGQSRILTRMTGAGLGRPLTANEVSVDMSVTTAMDTGLGDMGRHVHSVRNGLNCIMSG